MSEEHKNCTGNCSNCSHKQEEEKADCRLKQTLSRIKRKLVVMSGKGGVGKSTVSANLAMGLALEGYSVGLLDVDFHGPSIPKMVGLEGAQPTGTETSIDPVTVGTLKVMSLGFMLSDPDAAVIWRGPMKIGVIRQLLGDVNWGDLDYLVIDCPPGTGDEPLSVIQSIDCQGEAVVVTTPQQVASADVAKSLDFCNKLGFKVAGIIENMSTFICPKCGEVTEIFSSGAGEALAKRYQVPFLGKLPLDPAVCQGGDTGKPFVRYLAKTPVGAEFAKIVAAIDAAK